MIPSSVRTVGDRPEHESCRQSIGKRTYRVVFKSLKVEFIPDRRFGYKADAVAYVIDYLYFYNYKRRHSSLG